MRIFQKHVIFLAMVASIGNPLTPVHSSFASPVNAGISQLRESITLFNLEVHRISLENRSYRGEEGIMRISPEVGQSLGLKVVINEDYLKARDLYAKADSLKEQAIDLMTSTGSHASEKQIKKVADLAVEHNRAVDLAWESVSAYRASLTADIDDRMNDNLCVPVLDGLLQENLEKASYNLRDGLGLFFNQCQDMKDAPPLNLDNIKFVNRVFNEFTQKIPVATLEIYDLDRADKDDLEVSRAFWKKAMDRSGSRFMRELEATFEQNQNAEHPVDNLLFLALIRQESGFNPKNISYVGAAGLTQIMPGTAKALGMAKIYEPSYLEEAGAKLRQGRILREKAIDIFLSISEENSLALAKQALILMEKSMECSKRWKKLYAQYRKELLNTGTDQRLDPAKSIQYGYKYFSRMMAVQKGDISLALASYNAGPHRVKQYDGIPPYEETLDFRNKVISYYREYRSKVEKYRTTRAPEGDEPEEGGAGSALATDN